MIDQREQEMLVAGRVLDALIAEKVMGWQRARSPDSVDGKYLAILIPVTPTAPWQMLTGEEVQDTTYRNIPHYSTNISDAWLVVERMHARIHEDHDVWPHANYLTLSCCGAFHGWSAAFTCVNEGAEWYEYPEQFGGARGADAPLAICKAALEALHVR